eukprot:m.17676 g.17676  ORF g.17676 m.17676 type:complete len:302 (-) comp6078_c0_seq2:108-1013(-)
MASLHLFTALDLSSGNRKEEGLELSDDMGFFAKEIEEVEAGTHPTLAAAYRQLEYDFLVREFRAEAQKAYELDFAKKSFRQDEKALTQRTKLLKSSARKRKIQELESEKEKLNEWFKHSTIDGSRAEEGRESRKTRQSQKLNVEAQGQDPEGGAATSATDSQPPIIHLKLEDPDLEADLKHVTSTSKRGKAMQTTDPTKAFECFYEHKCTLDFKSIGDRLRYDGKWFYRGYKITVESPSHEGSKKNDNTRKQESQKITGVIFMFTPYEVWIRLQDLRKYSFLLSDLEKGTLAMRIATGREN